MRKNITALVTLLSMTALAANAEINDGHDLRKITTTGDYHVPVILVQFADASFSQGKGDPRGLFVEMLNGADFTQQNATGSANAYYRATSRGMFNPIFDVYGPVTMSRNEREYVATDPEDVYIDADGKEVTVYPAGRMVEEAVKALDKDVDFSQYDSDGDGMVDFVYLFFAGKGATTGGSTTATLWPHAFTLVSAIGEAVEVDGVKVNRYAISSELGTDSRLSGIGTLCHEFAHVLGLPDLYDTANNSGVASKCFTPGPYSCMDAGNYNNSEHTPPVFSSYEQYAMEWMTPVDIQGSGHLTLLPFEAWPMAYRVTRFDRPTEYYLLENRGSGYYDSKLPGAGMLVWHIDFDATAWAENRPNNDPSHMRIDLVEADNEKSESTRAGDPFPGSAGVCEFTQSVTPAFKDWNGNGMGYDLQGIRRNFDGTVEFDACCTPDVVMPGAFVAPPAPELVAAGPEELLINWQRLQTVDSDPAEVRYLVSVFDADAAGGSVVPFEAYVDGWFYREAELTSAADPDCEVRITGLEANKEYAVMVYAVNATAAVRMERPLIVRTVDPDNFESMRPNIAIYSENEGARVIWDNVPGADAELQVITRGHGADLSVESLDFSSDTMPEGWCGTGSYDARSKYHGASAPSYRLIDNDSYLASPVYEENVKSISFWCRKRFDDPVERCALDLYTCDLSGQWKFDRSISDFTSAGERKVIDFPQGVHGVKMVYRFWETGLDFNLDDLRIELCADGVAGEADCSVEYADNSAYISGLEKNNEYVAYVVYTSEESKASTPEVNFRLADLKPSAVEDVNDQDFSVKVRDGVVIPSDIMAAYSVWAIDGKKIAESIKGEYVLPAKGVYVIKPASAKMAVKVAN